jgi:zinc protease
VRSGKTFEQVMPHRRAHVLADVHAGGPDEVQRAIDAAVEKIKSEPVPDRELQKAKNQVEAAFVFGQDSIFGQALRIGMFESLAKWQLINDYLPGIRAVTAEDVLRVAKKYLDPDRRTIGVLIPTKESES